MTDESSPTRQRLRQVRNGDAEAARALVEDLHPLVVRIVRSHLPRRTAEEDLTQEVFLKLFARLDQYEERPEAAFEHWVARLTVRTCLDALRAEQRRPELRVSDLPPEQAAWLDYLVDTSAGQPATSPADAREVLERLLAQLDPADRLVIHLLDLDGKPVEEISSLTGWGRSAIKVRAFRARRRLRKIADSFRKQHPHERL